MGIIRQVFYGRELTIYPSGKCILTKKLLPVAEISHELIQKLIDYEVIKHDSGNFETGERHYIYNDDCRYKEQESINVIATKSENEELRLIYTKICRDYKLRKLLK